MDEAFGALRSGEINGIANVGVILLGLSRQFAADQSVVLLPRIEPLSSEAMACILPQMTAPGVILSTPPLST